MVKQWVSLHHSPLAEELVTVDQLLKLGVASVFGTGILSWFDYPGLLYWSGFRLIRT